MVRKLTWSVTILVLIAISAHTVIKPQTVYTLEGLYPNNQESTHHKLINYCRTSSYPHTPPEKLYGGSIREEFDPYQQHEPNWWRVDIDRHLMIPTIMLASEIELQAVEQPGLYLLPA